jgi:hypothetical protein
MRSNGFIIAMAALAVTGFGYALQAQSSPSASRVVVYKSPT